MITIPKLSDMHILRAMLVGGPIGALGLFGFVWWIAVRPATNPLIVNVYAFFMIFGWVMGWAAVYATHLEKGNAVRYEAHRQAKRAFIQSIHDDFDALSAKLPPDLAADLAVIRSNVGFGPGLRLSNEGKSL